MRQVIIAALRASLVLWALCGISYPLLVTGVGQLLLPFEANGSLVRASDGTILGSRLIGQQWSGAEWFHGRPSATEPPYNAAASGGSNLGPTNPVLQRRLTTDRRALEAAQPTLTGQKLPSDMLTASASGLDPDITPANAALQVARVAAARGIAPERLAALVVRDTEPRALGVLGEPRVNVLRLNLDLQRAFATENRR